MFNFNRNNNNSTASTTSGNSFSTTSSWMSNNTTSSAGLGFSFNNKPNTTATNTMGTTSLGFPSTSSTSAGTLGNGFTFNSGNNNNMFSNTATTTNNNNSLGSSGLFSTGTNTVGMFNTNNNNNTSTFASNNNPFNNNNNTTKANNNNTTTFGTSFASNSNPFTQNATPSNGFLSFSNNSTTLNKNDNGKLTSFPSFVPTPFTNPKNGGKEKYYSLTMMPHYKNKSFEECRYDYWSAQKNGTLPQSSMPSISTLSGGIGSNWLNSGATNNNTTTTAATTNNNNNNNFAWSATPAISTTTANNNSNPTFNFGLTNNNNTLGNNNNNNTIGSNWLSNNNTSSMFNSNATSTSNLYSTNNNNTTGNNNSLIGNTSATTNNMFSSGFNPTSGTSSGFNFTLSNGNTSNTNNTLPTTSSSAFAFPSMAANSNTAQPSMFNNGTSNNITSNNMFNIGSTASTTNNQPSQPFSWSTPSNNLTSTNPTPNFMSSFQPTATSGTTSNFNFSNTMAGNNFSNNVMATSTAPVNTDATLLSALNQPYGENSLYEEKYQPLTFLSKLDATEESANDENTTTKESSPTFISRPRLGKVKKSTLAEKLTLINTQAQLEDKQQTQENLFDDLAFRHKNSLKELTIFPNNAFKNNEKPNYHSEDSIIVSHQERISSTIYVNTANQPQQSQQQRRASPPSNADLVKPKPIKGMIFQDGQEYTKKEQVTVPKFLPKLTKEGYYTIPSMKELSMMNTADLKRCRNFTIGRYGYGEIQVLGNIDLTKGLDLDHIICEIEKHHVDLYSNHSQNEKPPVGCELNRPCIITLFNVHPSQNTKSSTTLTQFQAKLKKANQKTGSEFINYSNGQWIFKVNHF